MDRSYNYMDRGYNNYYMDMDRGYIWTWRGLYMDRGDSLELLYIAGPEEISC